jgi:hypothetical protein
MMRTIIISGTWLRAQIGGEPGADFTLLGNGAGQWNEAMDDG